MSTLKRSGVNIFITTEYWILKDQEGNRALSKSNLKKLREKISSRNMLKYHPILVNSQMEVIDGQHRLAIAKEFGLPISIINIGDQDISETMSINTTGEKWSLKDFLESYSSRGSLPYSKIKAFIGEYDFFSLPQAIYACKGKNASKDFKEGNLIISPSEFNLAVDLAMKMTQFSCVHKKLKSHSFLQRAVRKLIKDDVSWDHQRLIDLCMENQSKLLSMPHNVPVIIDTLESIYNKHLKKRVSFTGVK